MTIGAPSAFAFSKNAARPAPSSGQTIRFSLSRASGLPTTCSLRRARFTAPFSTTPGKAASTGPTAAPPGA